MLKSLLLTLSRSKRLRRFAETSSIGNRLSSRFVAGTQLEDVLRVTEAVNAQDTFVSIDYLGENVGSADEARRSAELYHQMLDQVDSRKLMANVSIKLTHVGLDISADLAFRLLKQLVEHAVLINNFVRIDMEGSAYTQRTLEIVRALHREPGNGSHIGAVIQAYLRRSKQDVSDLLAEQIRVRLCKGAYKEPPESAYPKKTDVDGNYLSLARTLLRSDIYHGIATHDEAIITDLKRFAQDENIPRSSFEFQMLYGVRRALQQQLVKEGYRLRVYIPFGAEWYPYLMRRLAERPANLFFVAKNVFRK